MMIMVVIIVMTNKIISRKTTYEQYVEQIKRTFICLGQIDILTSKLHGLHQDLCEFLFIFSCESFILTVFKYLECRDCQGPV